MQIEYPRHWQCTLPILAEVPLLHCWKTNDRFLTVGYTVDVGRIKIIQPFRSEQVDSWHFSCLNDQGSIPRVVEESYLSSGSLGERWKPGSPIFQIVNSFCGDEQVHSHHLLGFLQVWHTKEPHSVLMITLFHGERECDCRAREVPAVNTGNSATSGMIGP